MPHWARPHLVVFHLQNHPHVGQSARFLSVDVGKRNKEQTIASRFIEKSRKVGVPIQKPGESGDYSNYLRHTQNGKQVVTETCWSPTAEEVGGCDLEGSTITRRHAPEIHLVLLTVDSSDSWSTKELKR